MKKHLLTCAVALALIVGTFFVVFTFENMLFALARVQFVPTSTSFGAGVEGQQSPRQTRMDRTRIEDNLQPINRQADETSAPDDRHPTLAEIARAAIR